MINSLKERYNELKKYSNILLNYDDILMFYPDYYKTKIQLENESFIAKDEVDKEFNENYKSSKLYKNLVKLAMDKEEIYLFMNHNKDFKYNSFKSIYERLIQSCIRLCNLIDYIGHYPLTYPVPKEEEKNFEMEELLEKYDIMVRYYLGDIDEMQIVSDDVVRIIDTLETQLNLIKFMKENTIIDKNWVFIRKESEEKMIKDDEFILNGIDEFPLSAYQKQQKSRREEEKRYLRLQHGKNII